MKKIFTSKKFNFILIFFILLFLGILGYFILLQNYYSEVVTGYGGNKSYSWINSNTNMWEDLAIKLKMKFLCNLTSGADAGDYFLPPERSAFECQAKFVATYGGVAECTNHTDDSDYRDNCLKYFAESAKSVDDCNQLDSVASNFPYNLKYYCISNLAFTQRNSKVCDLIPKDYNEELTGSYKNCVDQIKVYDLL